MSFKVLNYKKGFLRLWAVLTLFWIIFVGFTGYYPVKSVMWQLNGELVGSPDCPGTISDDSVDSTSKILSEKQQKCLILEEKKIKQKALNEIYFYLSAAFIPPIVLFLICLSFIWVFKGFKKPD